MIALGKVGGMRSPAEARFREQAGRPGIDYQKATEIRA